MNDTLPLLFILIFVPSTQAAPIICQIDTSQVLGRVPSTLFGTNMEWTDNGNGLIHNGVLDAGLTKTATQQGISLVRFPGGTFSDYYHWRDGTGLLSKRPVRPDYTDLGSSTNSFGTPELALFCETIGASPLLTVNAGSGTAKEAADWVTYCNSPYDPRRKADGLATPLGVKYWEVGNELYLPGNPGTVNVSIKPEEYAQRFLEFSKEMRAADPSISIIGIGTTPSTPIPLPYQNWTEELLKKAASEIDYIAVHNAYFPVIFNENGLTPQQVYETMWASPEAVDQSLFSLEKLIAKYQQHRDINIAITEWGALFSFDPAWIDQVKTLGTAVYCDRLIQVFLKHPKVKMANYFKFSDRYAMGWVTEQNVPKVPYFVIELFTRHFGTQLVMSNCEGGAIFTTPQLSNTFGQTNTPVITAVASLDQQGKILFVNLVNRSWDTAYPVKFRLAAGMLPHKAVIWSISAPSATDNNGVDLPADFPVKWIEPPMTPGFVGPIQIQESACNPQNPVVVPPHSIMTLQMALP